MIIVLPFGVVEEFLEGLQNVALKVKKVHSIH